eukprot:14843636-Alexandrium_andersonii.AAC.1
MGWLVKAKPNRSGEVWSVRIPGVQKPLNIARYVRRDPSCTERTSRARASSWNMPPTKARQEFDCALE